MEDQKVFSRMKSEIKRLAKKQEQAYLDEYNEKQNQMNLSMHEDAKEHAVQYYDNSLRTLQKEMKSELMHMKLKFQSQLIENRNQKCDEVFEEVKRELIDFTSSINYKDWLMHKLNNQGAKECILYVNQITFDLIKNDVLEFNDILVRDMLGGFVIENKEMNITMDCSFDAVLQEQKEWFYMNCNLLIK